MCTASVDDNKEGNIRFLAELLALELEQKPPLQMALRILALECVDFSLALEHRLKSVDFHNLVFENSDSCLSNYLDLAES